MRRDLAPTSVYNNIVIYQNSYYSFSFSFQKDVTPVIQRKMIFLYHFSLYPSYHFIHSSSYIRRDITPTSLYSNIVIYQNSFYSFFFSFQRDITPVFQRKMIFLYHFTLYPSYHFIHTSSYIRRDITPTSVYNNIVIYQNSFYSFFFSFQREVTPVLQRKMIFLYHFTLYPSYHFIHSSSHIRRDITPTSLYNNIVIYQNSYYSILFSFQRDVTPVLQSKIIFLYHFTLYPSYPFVHTSSYIRRDIAPTSVYNNIVIYQNSFYSLSFSFQRDITPVLQRKIIFLYHFTSYPSYHFIHSSSYIRRDITPTSVYSNIVIYQNSFYSFLFSFQRDVTSMLQRKKYILIPFHFISFISLCTHFKLHQKRHCAYFCV